MQEVDLYLSFPSAVLSRQLHILDQELAIGVISRRDGGLQVGGRDEGGTGGGNEVTGGL